MASTNNLSAEEDNYEDLFDYNAEIPDIDITNSPPPNPGKSLASITDAGEKYTLGIDKEVKIRKRRVDVKLDAERLLSDIGIPKLRREAPKRLKFKGKGHEYRDASRLLQFYQQWADELFKKARFKDTLTIIEKLGHTKEMRERRLVWIDEAREAKRPRISSSPEDRGKMKENEKEGEINDDDLYELPQTRPVGSAKDGARTADHASSSAALFLPGEDESEDEFGGPDDEELDALMDAALKASAAEAAAAESGSRSGSGSGGTESEARKEVPAPQMDDFNDEMEAMAGMDWE
ncbi:chromosome segregation in meiosis-related protein [Rhizina undulata]